MSAPENGPAKGDLTIFLMCFGPITAYVTWCVVALITKVT